MRLITLIFLSLCTSLAFAQSPNYHPFCIEELLDSDWEKPFDMRECQSRHDSTDLKSEDELRPTYRVDRYHSPEDGGGWGGFVRYTIAAQIGRLMDIEYAYNGGGSGTFHQLFTIGLNDDGTVEVLAYVPFGDRCNDGGARFIKSYGMGATEVVISSDATPFRLLNPHNRFNWRNAGLVKSIAQADPKATAESVIEKIDPPEMLNGWAPYDDIDNAAMSCAGEVHWKYSNKIKSWTPSKLYINDTAFDDVSRDKEKSECIASWFSAIATQKKRVDRTSQYEFDSAEWDEHLADLTQQCAEGGGLVEWAMKKLW